VVVNRSNLDYQIARIIAPAAAPLPAAPPPDTAPPPAALFPAAASPPETASPPVAIPPPEISHLPPSHDQAMPPQ